MGTVHIDFETRSTVDLRKTGADVYARHPSTDVLCMAWALDDGPVNLWKLGDGLENCPPMGVHTFIAHNAPFELAIWNHVCTKKYGWPALNPSDVFCTMAMAYAMALPGSLEKAAAATGMTAQKDMAGNRVMMQLSQPRSYNADGTPVWWDDPVKFEKLYAYCKQDIEVERELHKRLLPLSKREREVWEMDYRINQRGVLVDLKAVKAAIRLVEFEKERLDQLMKKVTGNQVGSCSAVSQLSDWLRWSGVKDIDGVAKSDVVELLKREDLPLRCREALLLRQEAAKSSTAKLVSMLNSVGSDGRIRGIYQYHGAGTGRWAGRRIQPQNFPRPKISQDEIKEIFEILGAIQ